tara:strand:- start:1728 stop:2819 length:1092 start_codon:yes stop_codon:yes gene_type:complete
MSNAGMTKQKNFYTKKFKGTARLIVWLNLGKLGISNCTDSFQIIPIIEKEITTKGKIVGGEFDGAMLWIEPSRMVKQDINTVFGGYDYDKLKNYYLYPFDFFAIDVSFVIDQCLSKGGTFTEGTALDCVNKPPVLPPPTTSQVLWLNAELGINASSPLDNDNVYQWNDQSGNSNHFVQSTAINQPIYNATGIGGKSSITFDIKSMKLENTILMGTDYTIYCVFKTTTNTTATPYKTVFSFSNDGIFAQGSGRVGMAIDTGYTNFYYDDRISKSVIIPHDTDAHYFTISNGDISGTSKKQIYADSVNYIDGVAAIDSSQLFHIIGTWNGQHGNFQMAELICYNIKHSAVEQAAVELYLKTKYAL